MTLPVQASIPFGRTKSFWVRALALLTIAAVFSGCTLIPSRSVPTMSVVAPAETRIPARIVSNFFLVESRQDNGNVARFLIDTGSSATLVSGALVDQLGTKPGRRQIRRFVRVRTANGAETELPAANLRKLLLGDAQFTNVPVATFNFAELSNHLGIAIDGVLGFPLFRDVLLTLDYPGRTLRLASPRISQTPDAGRNPGLQSTVTFSLNHDTPILPVQLDGESFNVLIDTGSDSGLTLNTTGLHPKYVVAPRPGTIVSGLAGERRQQVGRLAQNLTLAGHVIQEPVVDLTSQLSSVGGELLRNFRITMDQYRRTAVFRRDEAGPVSVGPRRSTGISFARSPKYWRVIGIVPETPAVELPVKESDLCVKINGEPVDQWTFERYEELIRSIDSITYTFVVGSQEQDVKATVFELVH